MHQITRHFNLHGGFLAVRSSVEELARCATYVCECVGATPVQRKRASTDLRIDLGLTSAVPSLPADAVLYQEMDHGVKLWRNERTAFVTRGQALVEIDIEESVAQGHLPSPLEVRSVYLLMTLALVILLGRRGLYALHAAGAVDAHERGYLFVGSSDSGKSTLAYSLVREGWSYLSDDSHLLGLQNGEIIARPFRRDFCVDASAIDHFPELSPQKLIPSLFDDEKVRVDLADVFDGRRGELMIPKVIVFPRIARRSSSELIPIDRKEAMLRLLPQSGLLIHPDPSEVAHHLELLKIMIESAETYHLNTGTDIFDDQAPLTRLFSERIHVA